MTDPLDHDIRPRAEDPLEQHLSEVQLLLSRYRRVEDMVERQEAHSPELAEEIARKQHLVDLQKLLERIDTAHIARIIETLAEEDGVLTWQQVPESRCEPILELLPDDLREELVGARSYASVRNMLNAFELKNGRLSQVQVESRADLANLKPIWVDLVAPSPFVRAWVGKYFGLELPDPEDLTDLEASARFYVDDTGELHLHSDFLLDKPDGKARNVAVALILHNNILFSVRNEELPVFRLQRLRARTQPGYVTDGLDVLLDLYDADVEYSADALEDIYAELEEVGRQVLSPHVSDDEAAEILAEIAKGEDLNGRIRRNVLDTRRALSFLMRSRFLSQNQQEDARQILRDIESLDGHTTFLFGKINFLMDATVGFININQNKRVSKLTTVGVVFTPINIIAGIGGMSEFSMMTEGTSWPIAYGAFTLAMFIIGFGAYHALRYFEQRTTKRLLAAHRRREV
jgi:magnesium transporter